MLLTVLFLLSFSACRVAEVAETVTPGAVVFTPTPQIGVSFATRPAPTAAVLQTTPTPLPSPTITPTATPIIDQIAAGDTILGLALRRGTTVDAILALNPGIVPENLQIGQPLILPPPATAAALAAQETSRPLQVTVTKIRSYQTPIGSLWLLGEVTNEGPEAVENVQVEIELLAADGRSLATVSAWTAVPIILPGEQAPFGLLLNEPPPGYFQPAVAIAASQALVELGTRSLEVAVVEEDFAWLDDRVALSGAAVNDGLEAVTNVQLIATFYDAQGNVTGFLKQLIADRLEPGETRPFRSEAAPPGGESVAYSLQVEAQRASIDN